VKRDYLAWLTAAAVYVALAGCAGTTDPHYSSTSETTRSESVRPTPVFVIPNCQPLAGERRCYWIEPRGFQPGTPKPASTKQVHGIAL